jgi:hypothetical protein
MLRSRNCLGTSCIIELTCGPILRPREVRLICTRSRYEDFCADVRASLRMIVRHVGLSTEEFPYERCPTDLSPTNAKWIDAAPPEAIATVEDIHGSPSCGTRIM